LSPIGPFLGRSKNIGFGCLERSLAGELVVEIIAAGPELIRHPIELLPRFSKPSPCLAASYRDPHHSPGAHQAPSTPSQDLDQA
jgi:hypothetical protein